MEPIFSSESSVDFQRNTRDLSQTTTGVTTLNLTRHTATTEGAILSFVAWMGKEAILAQLKVLYQQCRVIIEAGALSRHSCNKQYISDYTSVGSARAK
jgi:hypothetical protein